MKQSRVLKGLLWLALFIGAFLGIAYVLSDKGQPVTAADCRQYCLPKTGVMETNGPTVGPSWRPIRFNTECVCK
jgi:hypothetical protein